MGIYPSVPSSDLDRKGVPLRKTLAYLAKYGTTDIPALKQARANNPVVAKSYELYLRLQSAPPDQQKEYVQAFEAGYSHAWSQGKPKYDQEMAEARELEKQRNRQYRRLTKELLAHTPDDQLEDAVMYYARGKIGSHWDRYYQIVSRLPRGISLVFAMRTMEGEVNGDGFEHLLDCPAWQFAGLALEGYRLVGGRKHAALMERAIAAMQKEKQQPTRTDPDEENPIFEALDKEFYSLDETENTKPLIVKYVRQHPDQFVAD